MAGFGELIRGYRRAEGLTQEQLARRAGVSVGAVRDLEQGRTRRPRPASLRRLAGSFGADEARRRELLSGLDGAPPGSRPAPGGPPAHGGLPAHDSLAAARSPRLEVLGPLAAWCDGRPVPLGPERQRAVAGLLAIGRGATLHRDVIIDALWGERPPASAVAMLQSYVSRLRRSLNGTGLEVTGAGYRLRAGDELDLYRFGQTVRRARLAQANGAAAVACDLYQQALALWRGEPLADIDVLRGHPAIVALAEERADVIVDYADMAAAIGDPGRVLPLLRELAARDPLDERVHARLMIGLAGTGRQAAALGVYGELARRLDRELGVRPGAELTAAHSRVLRQDVPAPAARVRASLLTASYS